MSKYYVILICDVDSAGNAGSENGRVYLDTAELWQVATELDYGIDWPVRSLGQKIESVIENEGSD